MHWSLCIAALWAAASAIRAVQLVLHAVRLRKLWQTAVPIAPAAQLASAALRVRGPVSLCTTECLERPGAIGFFAPRILIPAWLLQRLSPAELGQIVLHEAEHLRRRDDWTNLLQKLCLVAFPLNPALWWMERRLCREREMACDDGVVQATGQPRAYAACLAGLAERSLQRRAEALSLGAWQHRSELASRVHRILRRQHPLSPFAARLLLGALGFAVLGGAAELARSPQLIGFTAPESAVASASAVPAQLQPAHLLRASFAPASPSAPVPAEAKIGPSAKKATLPANRPAIQAAGQPSRQPTDWNNPEEEASASEPGPGQSPRQFLTAELAGSQPGPTQETQWLVFTAWEQVQPPPEIVEPYSAAAAGRTGQPNRQITFTRLILKVVPASSVPAQPVAVPIRGGWLFLQL